MKRCVWGLLSLAPLVFGQYYNVTTVAGNGRSLFTGAGGSALSAQLILPRAVAVDSAGNVLVTDSYFDQVYRISAAGIITVVAGTGITGFSGDGGDATAAQLNNPEGLAFDPTGNLYIADLGNGRIRKVTPAGQISTLATVAVNSLASDAAGILYASQTANHVVLRVSPDGTSSIMAGNGTAGFSGDGGQATSAMLFEPRGVKVDSAGNVVVADSQNNRIRRITPQGVISTVAGNGQSRFAGDGGPAISASLSIPSDIALDAVNTMYISDTSSARLRVVSPGGAISTAVGGGSNLVDGPANETSLPGVSGIALDNAGRVVMVVPFVRQVRRYAPNSVTTLAGVLPSANSGNNLIATQTPLLSPAGVAVDADGNMLVSDTLDNRVRKISAAGLITTAAGNGIYGATTGTDPLATSFGNPTGLTFSAENLYVGTGFGAGVYRISKANALTKISGAGGGFSGDGGPATQALFLGVGALVLDASGNLFIADRNNNRVRRVDPAGIVTTVAGTGVAGFSGDGGLATAAQLFQPRDVALDAAGNLYIADGGNARVRKVTPSGVITTVAGNGTAGFTGDGAQATAAQVTVNGVVIDAQGNIYISSAARVRKVAASSGIISTIAGSGAVGYSGDGGLATNATFNGIGAMAMDASGAIYVADAGNFRVRKLTPAQIVTEGVANGGTLRAGPVAPGEIVSIFGFNIGPVTPQGLALTPEGKVATEVGGTRVLFDGVPGPLTYVSAGQVNVIVPYGVAGAATTRIQVVYQGTATNTITVPVTAASPGIFAITNQDGQVNSTGNPAAQGSILILYATGEGQTDPPGVDGNVSNSVFPKPVLPVTVQIGNQAGTVLYAGAAPGFVSGVLQVNVQLPASLRGTQALQLRIGSAATPAGLNISIR